MPTSRTNMGSRSPFSNTQKKLIYEKVKVYLQVATILLIESNWSGKLIFRTSFLALITIVPSLPRVNIHL